MKRANYSDQQKAEALAALKANGGNLKKTARDIGIPRQTLQEWRDARVPEGVPELRHHVEECLADRIEGLLGVIVGELHKKADQAKFSELAFGMEKATNAMRLLREQPTSIHENREELTEEDASDLATVLQRAGDTRTVVVHTGPGPRPAPADGPAGPVH